MSKTKVQITMDDELLKELDYFCEKNYMNRSWFISNSVLQIINQQKMIDAITNVSIAVRKAAETGVINEDTKRELESFEVLTKLFINQR